MLDLPLDRSARIGALAFVLHRRKRRDRRLLRLVFDAGALRSRLDRGQFRGNALFGMRRQFPLIGGAPLRQFSGLAFGRLPCARLLGRRALCACAPGCGCTRLGFALGAPACGLGRIGIGARALPGLFFRMRFGRETRLGRRVQTALCFGVLTRHGCRRRFGFG